MLRTATTTIILLGVVARALAQCVIFSLEHYVADQQVASVLQARVVAS